MTRSYARQLTEGFWPYWRDYDDSPVGGVLNMISNVGDELVARDKFTWSQGRYLWLLAELLDLGRRGLLPFDPEALEDIAMRLEAARGFILAYAIRADDRCHYLLDAQGLARPEPRSGRDDASIFSDCFIAIGLANALRVAGPTEDDPGNARLRRLFVEIVRRIETGDYLTEPYPLPEGYRSHSIPMILLNTAVEVEKAWAAHVEAGHAEDLGWAEQVADRAAEEILTVHVDFARGQIREYVSNDAQATTQLLDRHRNPGHAIEDIWFLLEHAARRGRVEALAEPLTQLALSVLDAGWDEVHGGLLRFIDCDGGPPQGAHGDEAFERLILDSWDMKLWWPHSELLYTLLVLHALDRDPRVEARYEEAADYIFATFPAPAGREWTQIRNRRGEPEEKLVALPVKDPFHIIRAWCRIVELAEQSPRVAELLRRTGGLDDGAAAPAEAGR